MHGSYRYPWFESGMKNRFMNNRFVAYISIIMFFYCFGFVICIHISIYKIECIICDVICNSVYTV